MELITRNIILEAAGKLVNNYDEELKSNLPNRQEIYELI